MDKEFWNQRYAEQGFAYGLQPNAFLLSQARRFHPGARLLVIGDGEGRNGVWLAGLGLLVTSVDMAEQGLTKARELAQQAGVELETVCADLAGWAWPQARFDFVVSIFVHFPPALRQSIHRACLAALKPGGQIILEGFTPEQLRFSSGGPRREDMMFTEDLLRADFAGARLELLETDKVILDEGPYHQGEAAVIRLIATRS